MSFSKPERSSPAPTTGEGRAVVALGEALGEHDALVTMRLSALLVAAILSLGLSCKGDDPPPPPPPPPECGNGLLEAGESCEGSPPPMGCDLVSCTVDPEWFCVPAVPVPPEGDSGGEVEPMEWMSTCELLDTCGDGIIDPEEDCDDGDMMVADGCSGCRVDPLYTCVGEPSECFKCGDGFLDPGEDCDDGEDIGSNSQGCTNCKVNPGWDCFEMPPPSLCSPICGDGIWIDDSLEGITVGIAEQCDDGNLVPGDGCNASCRIEADCECTGSPPGPATCVCGLGSSTGTGTGSDSGTGTGSDTGTSTGTGSDTGTTGGSSSTG